jgi:ElaB protein
MIGASLWHPPEGVLPRSGLDDFYFNALTRALIMDTSARVTPTNRDDDGTVGRKIDQAATGTHEAIQRATDAARPTVDRMASGAHRAVDRIADVATQAADTLSVKGGQLHDAQDRLLKNTGMYMRDHPIATVGMAVAAGFLLSRLFSSR